jgi:hypothetical protein
LLHSDGTLPNHGKSIVTCLLVSLGTCLPNRCLAMNVYSCSAISAFRRHVTISYVLSTISLHYNILKFSLKYLYLDILRKKCEICQLSFRLKHVCGFGELCLQACCGPGEVLISLSYLFCIGSKAMTDPEAEN